MKASFTSKFFSGNRRHLQNLTDPNVPIVIAANGLLQQAADEAYPFHQDRNFFYLTGIDEPSLVLVIDGDEEYIIVPPRETVVEQFDGVVDFQDVARISGVGQVLSEKEGWHKLAARLKTAKQVATVQAPPHFIKYLGIYTNPARAGLVKRMKRVNAKLEVIDLRTQLARLRMVKQSEEIKALQKAVDITCDTIEDIVQAKNLAAYAYEYEVEADISHGFRRRGAQGHAFHPVVSSGIRTCTLHYMKASEPLMQGELLLMDVGAQYGYYAADICRTVALNGKPTARQQAVYNAVFDAQEYAYSLLKPGIILQQYEKEVEAYIGKKLRELGVIKEASSETIRRYFPHRTSHFLGLDTHDAGDYEHPLEPGVVLTVEPGIYLPEEKIGVRIEDDVLITPTGCKVLSKRLPRRLS